MAQHVDPGLRLGADARADCGQPGIYPGAEDVGPVVVEQPELGEDRDVVASTLAKTFGKTVAPLALGRQI